MPKTKKSAVKVDKSKKQLLSPAERSQIAKDRWAKIRAAKAAQDKPDPVKEWVDEAVKDGLLDPAPPVVEQTHAGRDENGVPSIVGLGDGKVLPIGAFVPENTPIPAAPIVVTSAVPVAPVRAPKQKRYQGPKEFSVALKAAEARLAKAINERAEAMGKLAGLNAEIPSLLQIINALKGPSNNPAAPYDFGGVTNPMAAFQPPAVPFQAPVVDTQAAIMAAMAQPPVSKARGNAVELSPDVVGELEGPDDDEDRFLKGPNAGGGWIGG